MSPLCSAVGPEKKTAGLCVYSASPTPRPLDLRVPLGKACHLIMTLTRLAKDEILKVAGRTKEPSPTTSWKLGK